MSGYSPKPGSSGRQSSNSPYDPFSTLASPVSSKPASRSLTPSNPPRPSVPPPRNASDAFSSLWDPSFSSQNSQDNLSLAARRAAAQKEIEAKAARDREVKQTDAAAWSGLDLLGQRSLNTTVPSAGAKGNPSTLDDDWLFDKPNPEASSSKPTAGSELVDDWGLSDFASQGHASTGAQSHPPTQGSTFLFNALDDSDSIPDSFGEGVPPPQLTEPTAETEDDILGALGKPIAPKPPSPKPLNSQVTPASTQERTLSSQTSSPPPHVIGQIVEMGFTPEQARLALASTDTGLDVQQALDTLLTNGVGAEHEEEPISDRPRRGLAEFRDEDEWEDQRRTSPPIRPPIQRRPSTSNEPRRSQKQAQSLLTPDIQERADKLLAQASEIGLNVFSRANALWKDGKEKVQRAYEERAAKPRTANDGRPRWMADAAGNADGQGPRGKTEGGRHAHAGFRDDDNDDVREELPPLETQQEYARQNRDASGHAAPRRTANLFDEEPAVYVSPARRRPVPSRATSQSTSSVVAAPSPVTRASQSSPPLRIRQAVSASASTIASSNTHKDKGTELYKLGQYANAEQAYSVAIDVLPANHILLIPLYNNRAVCRIKIGEHTGAIEDCTTVLSMIGPDYHPAREAKITREEEGASVDLADAYLKALRRRAEAYEGREKWELALKDWEAIIGCEWSARMRTDAFNGTSRCRKLLLPEKEPSTRAVSAPRPPVRPVVNKNQQDFEAVKKLRQANQAQEREEQAKASLKDSVDARLQAWKAGKETNVRALIASLETVLWPELGWQKVGLHELVAPSQVKVRYMKAIAKLHPDKINSSNTTVEQRMIANGVFASLNDAWTVFKQ